MRTGDLEIRRLDATLKDAFARFLSDLQSAGIDRFFWPHPFTDEHANLLASYSGEDLYYVLVEDGRILGYGMLRGWDEGFDIPSLGIALHPSVEGRGFAKVLMHFLHAVARYRGASRVRLRVHPENSRAVRLYRELGYQFTGEDKDQLVAFLDLTPNRTVSR